MRAVSAIALWTGPATFAVIGARVFAGDPAAPFLLVAAVLAPLLALMQRRSVASPPSLTAPEAAIAVVSAALILWAQLLIVADLGTALGITRWRSLAVVAALACIVMLVRGAGRYWAIGVPLGIAGLALPLLLIASAAEVPPWRAWAEVASRPAFAFPADSAWVTEGRTVARTTTLTFAEPHRVTAVQPATYRVTERDGAVVTVRELRLATGESVFVRSGDQLVIPAGAVVRFEAGKRVPGTAVSGIAWASRPLGTGGDGLVEALGIAVTLCGGAVALIRRPSGSRPALAVVPALLAAFALCAACWGIYAAHLGIELGLGATPSIAFAEALALSGVHPTVASPLTILAAAFLVLVIVTMFATRAQIKEVAVASVSLERRARARRGGDLLWLGMLAATIAAGMLALDAWRVLTTGLGLAASAWAAPRLGARRSAAWLASAAGAVAFAAFAWSAAELPLWASAVGLYPALAAAPLAWAIARMGRRRSA